MCKKTPLIVIGLLILASIAFIPPETIFSDGFEGRSLEANLERDYQIWETGAVLHIFLEDEIVNSGDNSLGVEIISSNPINQSKYGSVYRTMELFQGSWSGAVGIRFWVSNPNQDPLLLSFNLKERYREYWAVADEGPFYFQNQAGLISQQEIFYSNLSIPAGFNGFVIVPFESLAVPSWNTAKSNQVLDPNRIESYAFSVMVGEKTPFTFYIDDFEVIGQTTFYTLPIEGVSQIKIPPSGELLEAFNAELVSQDSQAKESVAVNWSLKEPYDPAVSISAEGILRVPAGTQDAVITVVAQLNTPEFNLENTLDVALEGENVPDLSKTPVTEIPPSAAQQSPAYDRFSVKFDAWTTDNRALFVGLLLLGVTIFLFVLAYIERKLK